MEKTRKNYYIELLRFIFCVIILLHHSGFVSENGSGIFPSGGVIADAFFMLTGYFACAHMARHSINLENAMGYSVKYTLSKIKRVLPYTTFGILIVYIPEFLHTRGASFGVIVNKLYTMTVELLLLPATGIIKMDLGTVRNAPLWYLSALLPALPVAMFISLKWKDIFKNYLVWLLPLSIQGWFVVRFGGALPWMDFAGFINSGVIRGFSGIVMGFGIYYMSQIGLNHSASSHTGHNGDNKSLKIKRLIFTFAEILLLALIIINIIRGVGGYDEVGTIYLIYFMLTISLSGLSYTSNINIKFFSYLGKLSLPIYCIHWGIYRLASGYLADFSFAMSVTIVVIICVITAAILVALEERYAARKKL